MEEMGLRQVCGPMLCLIPDSDLKQRIAVKGLERLSFVYFLGSPANNKTRYSYTPSMVISFFLSVSLPLNAFLVSVYSALHQRRSGRK
jgi:hypothetical protein